MTIFDHLTLIDYILGAKNVVNAKIKIDVQNVCKIEIQKERIFLSKFEANCTGLKCE